MWILPGWLFPGSLKDAWKSPTLEALSYICCKASFTNAVQRSSGETDQKFPHLSVHTWSERQENVGLRCVHRCWTGSRRAIRPYVALAFNHHKLSEHSVFAGKGFVSLCETALSASIYLLYSLLKTRRSAVFAHLHLWISASVAAWVLIAHAA